MWSYTQKIFELVERRTSDSEVAGSNPGLDSCFYHRNKFSITGGQGCWRPLLMSHCKYFKNNLSVYFSVEISNMMVIFPIVDPWQCCVCCTRSGATRCTLWRTTCALCASPVTRGTLIAHRYTYAPPPLQNLAGPQDFYSPLSISLERSGWPRIRWCVIGGFQEQVQCLFVGLVALSFFVFNYFTFLFFSSIGW